MDKKEINEQFDTVDLILNRFGKSAKKLITILGSIVTLAIVSFYSIQENASKEREKLDYELRKDFITNINDSVKKIDDKVDKNSKDVSILKEKKLEKKDYIRKTINDEYAKVIKKDFKNVNSIAVDQIEEAINSGTFEDEPVMQNAGNYISDKYRTWTFYNKNLK